MEKLINDMVQRVGIDRATAERVCTYLRDNASRLPEMLEGQQGVMGKVSNKMGEMFGNMRK
jgi:hypothetical protein